jgi:hypothetical protein
MIQHIIVGYAVKLLQTQWENKEKMIRHIIIISSVLTPYEKNLLKGKNPYSLENNIYVMYTFLKTPMGKTESTTYDLVLILPH